MRILVTGAAGFIGNELCLQLVEKGHDVLGIDNLNDYYSPQLKKDRVARLEGLANFEFVKANIADKSQMTELYKSFKPERTAHMAAQAGVRYSLEHPEVYSESNLVGFLNILELCRHEGTDHLVYASSSSVYGANTLMPFSEHHSTEHPVSLYAATKKANEMMAHSYSHLFGLPCTGLRFFHGVWPLGTPRYGNFQIHECDSQWRPHRCVQSRTSQKGLHLHL
jgi:UDP-glucuronate 4-epimerase